MSDKISFMKQWAKEPLKIGAVVPSSRWLSNAIVRSIETNVGHILEFGPGTGVFTEALIRKGVHQKNITLIERDAVMSDILRLKFKETRVITADASCYAFRQHGLLDCGAAVSGLPMRSMRPIDIYMILLNAFHALRTDALFLQFTYFSRCPVPAAIMDALGLASCRKELVLRNFPPAFVFEIFKTNKLFSGVSHNAPDWTC